MPFGFDLWASLCRPLGAFLLFGFLISGYLFAIYFEYDFQLVRFHFCLVALVWACRLVWVRRHLVQTAWAKIGSASSKILPTPLPGNPFGKILNDWSTCRYDPRIRKTGLKILDIYWHRIWKWTNVPLGPGLSPVITSLGLTKTPPLTQTDNARWHQSTLGYQGQSEDYLV